MESKAEGCRSLWVSSSVISIMRVPPWLNVGFGRKKLVDIRKGGLDCSDEISETKIMHTADRMIFPLREHKFGGHGHVRGRIVFFWLGCRAEPVCPKCGLTCLWKLTSRWRRWSDTRTCGVRMVLSGAHRS